jgi:hypothetical protein
MLDMHKSSMVFGVVIIWHIWQFWHIWHIWHTWQFWQILANLVILAKFF